MPSTIITKNSSTASSVPSAGSLTQGELAVNVADKRLYTKDSGGTVVELGTNPASLTMPNGTANTVPYLNGSKVVTSGTALQFDGTNLGIATTPSSWNSDYKAVDVSPYGNLYGRVSTQNMGVTLNCYRNSGGSWIYKNTAQASRYDQDSGFHIWYNAASGTAGNAITFTQAMTLDASGNLGVGVTSPLAKIHAVQAVSGTSFTWSDNTYDSGFLDIINQAARIRANNNLVFNTNGADRARIDSSGNLLVGLTSAAIGGDTKMVQAAGWIAPRSTTVPSGGMGGSTIFAKERVYFGDNTGWTWDWYTVNSGGTTFRRFYYTDAGAAYNATGTWGSISDAKLKENIVDATPKLAGLMQVKVRNYNLIGETTKQIGVVAQELETVFPAMVENTVDKDEEGNELGTVTKAVKYSVFVPMLIKAIQEQQALITQLQADVAALKA